MLVSTLPARAEIQTAQGGIFRLRVARAGVVEEGTCVLAHREDTATGSTLYFLTSARLVAGSAAPQGPQVSIALNGGRPIDVQPSGVFVPSGPDADIAILRVSTPRSAWTPRPITYTVPQPGRVVLISGHNTDGASTTVAEHIQLDAAARISGDRIPSSLHACVGAPAIAAEGVFGIVTMCDESHPPVIAPLSGARPFIAERIPGLRATPVSLPQFELVERQVSGPLLSVACAETKTGTLNVPLELGPHEWVAEATAGLQNPRGLRLGDLSMVKLEDRLVQLRFTLGGLPVPPLLVEPTVPHDCPLGQALVSLHLTLAVERQ